jgi:hypothetical protein
MKHEVQRLAAVLMLIAAAYFIADAVEKRSAAQTPEVVPPAEQSSGCAGGAISFTPQADGNVIVTCPQGVEK